MTSFWGSPNITFHTATGNDSRSAFVLPAINEDRPTLKIKNHTPPKDASARTATYTAILNQDNDLLSAVADMSVNSLIQPPAASEFEKTDDNPFGAKCVAAAAPPRKKNRTAGAAPTVPSSRVSDAISALRAALASCGSASAPSLAPPCLRR
jgi:hypothetical protein